MVEMTSERNALGFVGAWVWSVVAFLGSLLVLFGLGISDLIESEDWLLSAVFLLLFVLLPIALAITSYRMASHALSAFLVAGGLLMPPLLYWIVVYG